MVVTGNISQFLEWFILVDIFIGLLFTISVFTTYMTAPIPPHFWEALLPDGKLSVSSFLEFPLPSHVPFPSTYPAHKYWCCEEPNMEPELLTLKDLPIPSQLTLNNIIDTADKANNNSIWYFHATFCRGIQLPIWILTYWMEVSHLREHIRTPWVKAEAYLVGMSHKWHSPETRRLCDRAQLALLSLPWAGDICGFSDPEPTTRLAAYLSKGWLSTMHVNQQLDIL
jgi:hypothetical protein